MTRANGESVEAIVARLNIHLVASYLDCCNRTQEALELLKAARALGQRAPETTRLLVDLLLRHEQKIEAGRVVSADAALLTTHELQTVEVALR